MADHSFRVQQVDHIEVYVPDRYEAADWYRRVLGLEIVRRLEMWATVGGPLIISSDGGNTNLALFEGEPDGFRQPSGWRRVAFRVSGEDFLHFLGHLVEHPVYQDDDQLAHTLDIVDHGVAYSVYFFDPYGNRLEVISYDYDQLSGRLPA